MATHQESIFEGRTLDDAVRKGLEALGLSRAEVMITVMEEGSSGFLGLGARPYRVRVMPRPGGPPREPGERGSRDRRREGRRGERGERGEGRGREPSRGGRGRRDGRGEPARAEARREGGRGGRGGPGEDRPGREHAPQRADARGPMREAGPAGGGLQPGSAGGSGRAEGGEGRGRRRRGPRGRGRPDDAVTPRPETMGAAMGATGDVGYSPAHERVAPPAIETEAPPFERGERAPESEPRPRDERPRGERRERTEEPAMSGAELEARARRITEDLLAAMGFPAKITARAEGDNVDVIAEVSEDEDLLTGRKGEVRQALQHLLNLTINRGGGMRYHLQLEINEFWRRREAELQEQARAMADEAVVQGREVVTEYLNAQERRVIHVSLRDDGRVRTYAIGEGLIKKLAVAPAGQPEAARADD